MSELPHSGLLWLINITVFHPRGYALVLHTNESDDVIGWSLRGNGSMAFTFPDVSTEKQFQACRQTFESVG